MVQSAVGGEMAHGACPLQREWPKDMVAANVRGAGAWGTRNRADAA